jgi:hypothetical protein
MLIDAGADQTVLDGSGDLWYDVEPDHDDEE